MPTLTTPQRQKERRRGRRKIHHADETGEMSYVPWFEVWKGDQLFARVNASYVSEVFYQEGQS